MSNYTNGDKLKCAILVLKHKESDRPAQIAAGLSKGWISKQIAVQEAIVADYRAKAEADQMISTPCRQETLDEITLPDGAWARPANNRHKPPQ